MMVSRGREREERRRGRKIGLTQEYEKEYQRPRYYKCLVIKIISEFDRIRS
jgi:hypothetical protein